MSISEAQAKTLAQKVVPEWLRPFGRVVPPPNVALAGGAGDEDMTELAKELGVVLSPQSTGDNFDVEFSLPSVSNATPTTIVQIRGGAVARVIKAG